VLIEHRGSAPQVHPSAYVAPTAVVCGAVCIGPDTRVLFGAVLTAEDGEIQRRRQSGTRGHSGADSMTASLARAWRQGR
jgi:carbonic anhydrase/acetyltransferase-like protein (isoleucine patch superfamily)